MNNKDYRLKLIQEDNLSEYILDVSNNSITNTEEYDLIIKKDKLPFLLFLKEKSKDKHKYKSPHIIQESFKNKSFNIFKCYVINHMSNFDRSGLSWEYIKLYEDIMVSFLTYDYDKKWWMIYKNAIPYSNRNLKEKLIEAFLYYFKGNNCFINENKSIFDPEIINSEYINVVISDYQPEKDCSFFARNLYKLMNICLDKDNVYLDFMPQELKKKYLSYSL